MTISNLGTLRTSVNTWIVRTMDSSLFVEIASEITELLHGGLRDQTDRFWLVPPLRSRLMHDTDTLTVASAQAALPADWLEFERVWIDTNTGKDLSYVSQQQFATDWRRDQTGEPEIYTVDGDTVKFAPTDDATVQISYYQTLGALSLDADTNVILTAHPVVYRHGCLWKSFEWEGTLDRADREFTAFGASVRGLNAQKREAQQRGSTLRGRPSSVA